MKIKLGLISIILLLANCRDDNFNLHSTFENLKFNPALKAITTDFINESKCDRCIFELYIDVIEKDQLIDYTLKSRAYSTLYLRLNNPLFYFNVQGKKLYIYSGMEESIVGDKKYLNEIRTSNSTNFTIWNVEYLNGKYKINKRGTPAFTPKPIKTDSIKLP